MRFSVSVYAFHASARPASTALNTSGGNSPASKVLCAPTPIRENRSINAVSDGCVGQNRNTKLSCLKKSSEMRSFSAEIGLMNPTFDTAAGAELPTNEDNGCT